MTLSACVGLTDESAAIAPHITIQWHDSFSMAASKDSFSNGAKFTAATTIQSISYGQTLTLPSDWTDKRPNSDPKAPKRGFRFVNEAEASAVVYKQVNGNITPIYISAAGPLPPGHEDLEPKTACRIWFANDVDTATMISDFQSNYLEIDMTGTSSAECQYDATGAWLNI